jgi:hypothetical protein
MVGAPLFWTALGCGGRDLFRVFEPRFFLEDGPSGAAYLYRHFSPKRSRKELRCKQLPTSSACRVNLGARIELFV